MVGFALGIVALLQEQGDNPEYTWWADFKVGSSVTHRMVLNGRLQDGVQRRTVKSIRDDVIVLDQVNGIRAMGPSPSELEIPARKGGVLKPEKEGEEEIEAGGKKLKCRWGELRKPLANGKFEVVRYWLHDEVPGRMVQMRVTIDGGVTATLTASEWEKK